MTETSAGFSRRSLELDAASEVDRIVAFLQENVLRRLHRQGAVVGISGGIDSSVVLALCARAFGPQRVVGILLPEQESSPESAELAHELGARMRMAVREGGRELVVNLRPAELGHLTVRVAMVDGVLTAHIAAERPEAARLLQQTLPQLDGVLQSLGFSVDSVDVSYAGQQGQAGHDAPGAPSEGKVADGEFSEDTDADSPADVSVTASEPPSRGAPAPGGLNLLV